jgi:DNA-binding transcriptional LysR family regulator
VKTELELRHLRVFVAVVEHGTHTRAARSLGVSQSTVSETLSALERTLGVAPFRKTSQGLALTASGEVLLTHARRMLTQASQLVSDLAHASHEVSGTLVLSTVESVSAYVLPLCLSALRERWPQVRVEVITGVCDEIRAHVAAGKSELGLVLESTATAREDASILAKSRLLVVGGSAHPLRRSQVAPEQLRHVEFYMCDAAGNYNQALRQYFVAAELPPPKMQSLGTIEGVKRGIACAKSALGLLPELAVERELRAGALAEVHISPALPGLVLRAVYSGEGVVSPVVSDLIQSLRASPSLTHL